MYTYIRGVGTLCLTPGGYMANEEKINIIKALDKDAIKVVEQTMEMEYTFYKSIAETEEFDIISIPGEHGRPTSLEEKQFIMAQARKHGITVLFRVSMGKYAIVFKEDGKLTGVVPEDNYHGFRC